MTSKVLFECLDDLENKGIVDRDVVAEKPVRVEYSLTEMGETLEPVIEAVVEWGDTYLQPSLNEDDIVC